MLQVASMHEGNRLYITTFNSMYITCVVKKSPDVHSLTGLSSEQLARANFAGKSFIFVDKERAQNGHESLVSSQHYYR